MASAEAADFVVTAIADATGFVILERSRMEVTRQSQPEEITFLSDYQKTTFSSNIISPVVQSISGEEIETILAEFYPALSSPLLADSSGGDPASENSESKLPDE